MEEPNTRLVINFWNRITRFKRQKDNMLSNKPQHIKLAYQARTQHYLTYLSLPSNIHERNIIGDVVLGVIEFKPIKERPYFTYTTSGMSEHWLVTPQKQTLFVELVFYTLSQQDWVVDFVEKLAVYPSQHNTFYAVGQTIPLLGPIIDGSHLTALLLVEPFFEEPGFRYITTIKGKRPEVIWALPITEVEREFIIENGYQTFRNKLSGVKFLNLINMRRASLI